MDQLQQVCEMDSRELYWLAWEGPALVSGKYSLKHFRYTDFETELFVPDYIPWSTPLCLDQRRKPAVYTLVKISIMFLMFIQQVSCNLRMCLQNFSQV